MDAYRRKLATYLEPTELDYQHRLVFLAEVLWPSAYTPGAPILKNGAEISERIIRLRGFAANDVHRLYETPATHP